MYTPDRAIVAELKRCDPDLDVRWDRDKERWWVTCLGKDAILVRNDDGSYRPLDGRIVTRMRQEAWEYRQYYGAFHLLDRDTFIANRTHEHRQRMAKRDEFRQFAVEDMYPRVFGVGGATGRNKFTGWSGSAN